MRIVGCRTGYRNSRCRRAIAVDEQQVPEITRGSAIQIDDPPGPFAHGDVRIADVIIERGAQALARPH